MGLDIVSNIMAQEASNSLSVNEANMQNSLEKLSSGYQINKAADDASGLVISQHLQAQIGGFQQAQANTQSAINVVQTADGALNEVGTILQRINTLAVQSANTSATDSTAQQAAQSEVNQSLASISNIAQTTVYGNQNLLLNVSAANLNSDINYTFQVGYNDSSASQVTFSVTALTLQNLGLGASISGPATNTENISTITGSAGTAGTLALVVTAASGGLLTGASITSLSTGASGSTATIALTASTSFTIQLGGATAVTINLSTNESLGNIASAITGSVSGITVALDASGTGFDLSATTSITIGGSDPNAIGLSAGVTAYTAATVSFNGGTAVSVSAASNTSGGQISLTDVSGNTVSLTLSGALSSGSLTLTASAFSVTASNAITQVNSAIAAVSAMRGTFGAYQNELQHISDNETVMVQNLQASNAQIADTNMASQMVAFTQDQVLVQAGVSMLAQANQIPQMVLKLLS